MYKNLYINTTIKLTTGILEFKMVHENRKQNITKKLSSILVNNILYFLFFITHI